MSKTDLRNSAKTRATETESIAHTTSKQHASRAAVNKQMVVIGGTEGVDIARNFAALQKRPTVTYVSSSNSTFSMSVRNNFEHKESRKAILKSALVEIEQELSGI